jgi:O-antigen biosynthesis protein WbqV
LRILSSQKTRPSAGFAPRHLGLRAFLLQQLRRHRKTLVFSYDATMAIVACAVAFGLRLGWNTFSPPYYESLLTSVVVFAAVATPIFYLFHLHRQVWRYASLTDLVMIVKAVTLAVLIFMLAMFVFTRLNDVPRSLPVILWSVLIMLLGGPRLVDRWLRAVWLGWKNAHSRTRSIPVLVLGTSEEAQLFLRAIATGYGPLYRAVGVVDVSDDLTGRLIHGVPVLGRIEDLPAILARLTKAQRRPHRLIVTDVAERLPSPVKLALFERASEFGLTLARLPRLTDFKTLDRAREVQPIALEDLLGRPQVTLDRDGIRQMIADRQVLITGAGGSIGSELTRQIAALEPARLVLAEQNEYNLYKITQELAERFPRLEPVPLLCDVRNRGRLDHVFSKFKPEVVFHAAACKHVPLIECNPVEGVASNTLGTRNVADAARAHGVAAMVFISTDKAVNPTSIMGASKRLAEYYCQALDMMANAPRHQGTRFLTVRFGNVLGSSGSVVPLFQRQLANGGPLTVTHPEIQRYFMTIPEAVELILQASTHGLAAPEVRGRIFVLDMGEPIKIVDVAEQVIRLAGLEPYIDIKIEFTGLRPGEKLYEELFDTSETSVETSVPGVLAALPRPVELGRLKGAFACLEEAAEHHQIATIESVFNDLIPGFRLSERVA